jgi:hypothetical protein
MEVTDLQMVQAKEFLKKKRQVLIAVNLLCDAEDSGNYSLLIESHEKGLDTLKRKYRLSYKNFKQFKVELL